MGVSEKTILIDMDIGIMQATIFPGVERKVTLSLNRNSVGTRTLQILGSYGRDYCPTQPAATEA
jgi:hypothetical protein